MHYTAWLSLSIFYRLLSLSRKLDSDPLNILEIGSYAHSNLTANSVFDLKYHPTLSFPDIEYSYTGVDHISGPNVDVVIEEGKDMPFDMNTFDIIISTSAFEHDQMFWLTFLDMMRMLKPCGMLYLQVPSEGSEHRTPTDNWRFYRDAPYALEKWARRNGYNVDVMTAYIHNSDETRKVSLWNDHTMIFMKGSSHGEVVCDHEDKSVWAVFGDIFEQFVVNPTYVFAYANITNHTLFEVTMERNPEHPAVKLVYYEMKNMEWL